MIPMTQSVRSRANHKLTLLNIEAQRLFQNHNICNMLFKRILTYLNPLTMFRKAEGNNFNLRMMHGINRISIFLFLFCLIVMLVRYLSK